MTSALVLVLLAAGPATPPRSADTHALAQRARYTFRPAADHSLSVDPGAWKARRDGRGTVRFELRADAAPALALGNATLKRGALELPAQGDAYVTQRGELGVTRGEVRETWAALPQGLEVRWSFPRAPAGRGALEVSLPVAGLAFRSADADALHFGPGGEKGVKLSHATWIDAKGVRTHVPGRYVKGAVVYRVPQQVLEASAYPAVLDPLLSPELSIAATGLVGAAGWQHDPGISWDGTQYLVAWLDERENGQTSQIYASRVDGNGQVLDPTGIRVAGDFHGAGDLSVQLGPGAWSLFWLDGHSLPTAARVDGAGKVLDPAPVTLVPWEANQLRVAYDGTNYNFVVQYSGNSQDLYFGQLSPQLTELSTGIDLATDPGYQEDPSIACDGTGMCLAAWSDTNASPIEVKMQRVRNGVAVDATPVTLASCPSWCGSPRVGAGPSGFYVAWNDDRTGDDDLWGSPVQNDGTVTVPNGAALVVRSGHQWDAVPVWNGSGWTLSYYDYSLDRAFLLGVDAAGTPAAGGGVRLNPVNVTQGDTRLAWAADGGMAAWTEKTNGWQGDIRVSRVAAPTLPLDDGGVLVTAAAPAQVRPIITPGPSSSLMVWEDSSKGDVDLLAVRLSPEGTILDSTPIPIATDPGHQYAASIAWGAGAWLVAWEDESRSYETIMARRILEDGTIADVNAFAVAPPQGGDEWSAAVAFANDTWLVAFSDDRGPDVDILGVRVTATGAIQDATPLTLVQSSGHDLTPVLTTAGDTFMMAWHAHAAGTTYDYYVPMLSVFDAQGAEVTPAGGVELGPTDWMDTSELNTRLTCGPSECLVAWNTNGDLHGRVVSTTGAVQGFRPFAISSASEYQRRPTVTWDQGSFVAAWEDGRSHLAEELYTSRVTTAGVVVTPAGTALVSHAPSRIIAPSLAALGTGKLALSYSVFDSTPGVMSLRLKARFVYDVPEGGACQADGECASGFCVDGVCCDSACGGGAVDCQACGTAAGAAGNGRCQALGVGDTCRPAVGECDVAETCDGASMACPADGFQQNGQTCEGTGTCTQGVCVGAPPATPGFTTVPTTYMTCGEAYQYGKDGVPQVNGPGPVEYALAPLPGEALPDGLTVDKDTGALGWTPKAEHVGDHHVYLVARGAGWVAAQELVINVECNKREYPLGCSAAGVGGLAWVALALLARRRRR